MADWTVAEVLTPHVPRPVLMVCTGEGETRHFLYPAEAGPLAGALLAWLREQDAAAHAALVRREAEAAGLRVSPTGPRIVCLCGSTRFWRTFQDVGLRETMAGRIVLSIGAARGRDDDDKSFGGYVPEGEYDRAKSDLDALHLRKIDLADEVLVLNVGGYIGESTAREVRHALATGKSVRWLEPDAIPAAFAHLVDCTIEFGGQLEPPPNLLTAADAAALDDATMAALEDQAATQVFADKYGVDVDALVIEAKRAFSAAKVGHEFEDMVRAVLAAMGIEVRE